MIIDATRPIADGICFDDMAGMPTHVRNMLAARGLVFATQFEADDCIYSGSVIAATWERADEVAFGRGLGETVIGVLAKTVPAKGNHHGRG